MWNKLNIKENIMSWQLKLILQNFWLIEPECYMTLTEFLLLHCTPGCNWQAFKENNTLDITHPRLEDGKSLS